MMEYFRQILAALDGRDCLIVTGRCTYRVIDASECGMIGG